MPDKQKTPTSESNKQQSNRAAGHSEQQSLTKTSQRGGAAAGLPAYFASPAEFLANPFSAMRRMHEEMDRIFAQSFGGLGAGMMGGSQTNAGGGDLASWSPAIEVKQQGNELVVCAELPGLKPEEVQVEINEDALVIQGERRHEQTSHEGGMHRTERRYGRFYREIPIPEGVNTDQAKAEFLDGVLEVTVPLPEQQSRRRQIPISGGSDSSTARTGGTQSGSSNRT